MQSLKGISLIQYIIQLLEGGWLGAGMGGNGYGGRGLGQILFVGNKITGK